MRLQIQDDQDKSELYISGFAFGMAVAFPGKGILQFVRELRYADDTKG